MEKYLPQFDVEEDVFDRLPRVCLARKMGEDTPIMIKRGESGYFPVHPATDVELFNEQRGITAKQVEAMTIGSMFGWDVPGADPANA